MGRRELIVGAIRLLYHVFELLPKHRRISFLSRQSNRPFDFELLEPALASCIPGIEIRHACVREGGKLGAGMFLRQLYLVATSQACIVDGYVPAVSIPLKTRAHCIQLWHAVGAIKAFGYQCLDTAGGRSSADAQSFRMHRGYDCIVSGFPGAVSAFAKAFDADEAIIKPLGLPQLDYLTAPGFCEARKADVLAMRDRLGLKEGSGSVVLYAPTFRRGVEDEGWLARNVEALSRAFSGSDVRFVVAGHPLESWDSAHGNDDCGCFDAVALKGPTIKAIGLADLVISDYSAVALEAAYVGKRVVFYVPDIEEYRQSPGLNIDPLAEFPNDTFTDANELVDAWRQGKGVGEQFASFMRDYAGDMGPGAIERVAALVSDMMS